VLSVSVVTSSPARRRFTALTGRRQQGVGSNQTPATTKDVLLAKDLNKKHPGNGVAVKTSASPATAMSGKRGGGAMWGFYSYDPG
jgi:hypothetical protein